MNDILLKGKKDRLVVQLSSQADVPTLVNSLREKLSSTNNFFSGSETAIEFSGRKLTDSEEDELLKVISEQGVNITHFISEGFEPKQPVFLRKSIADEGYTKFYKGSLRSGNSVDVEGSVVILGDVNPGAAIKATGNIIVLGYLNGTAHAGGKDEEGAVIVSFKMNPIQIRIADNIARSPGDDVLGNNRVNKEGNLEIAYVKEKKIIIEDLSKESLGNLLKL